MVSYVVLGMVGTIAFAILLKVLIAVIWWTDLLWMILIGCIRERLRSIR
jgi:hypothetical protein